MLLETKGPMQQTKFDPQSGRGLRSRDHFYNFIVKLCDFGFARQFGEHYFSSLSK